MMVDEKSIKPIQSVCALDKASITIQAAMKDEKLKTTTNGKSKTTPRVREKVNVNRDTYRAEVRKIFAELMSTTSHLVGLVLYV